MELYEIYWDDLTPEAQERLKKIYHQNMDTMPLTTFTIESDDE